MQIKNKLNSNRTHLYLNHTIILHILFIISSIYYIPHPVLSNFSNRGHHGCDCMAVGFTTTFGNNAHHHWCCEFESRSERGVQHYVIKFCQWLATGRWFSPVSSSNNTDHHDITEILLKVVLNTTKQTNKTNILS